MFSQSILPYKKNRGSVLIFVLVLAIISALLIKTSLESAWFQQKMIGNYKVKLKNDIKNLNALRTQEQLLINQPINQGQLEFVPDSLDFDEEQGTNYYELKENNIKAIFAIRHLAYLNRDNK